MGDDLLDRDQLLDAFKSVGVEHVDEAVCTPCLFSFYLIKVLAYRPDILPTRPG